MLAAPADDAVVVDRVGYAGSAGNGSVEQVGSLSHTVRAFKHVRAAVKAAHDLAAVVDAIGDAGVARAEQVDHRLAPGGACVVEKGAVVGPALLMAETPTICPIIVDPIGFTINLQGCPGP